MLQQALARPHAYHVCIVLTGFASTSSLLLPCDEKLAPFIYLFGEERTNKL